MGTVSWQDKCLLVTNGEGDEEGNSEMEDGPNAQHCSGALIVLEKLEQPNQMIRISERLGLYDRRKLNMKAPVFDDFDEFAEAQGYD